MVSLNKQVHHPTNKADKRLVDDRLKNHIGWDCTGAIVEIVQKVCSLRGDQQLIIKCE